MNTETIETINKVDYPGDELEPKYDHVGYIKYIKSRWGMSWEAYRANSDKSGEHRQIVYDLMQMIGPTLEDKDDVWYYAEKANVYYRFNVACWNEMNIYVFEPKL